MEYLDIAVDCARKAGALQMQRFEEAHTVTRKEITHLVTEVDTACERLIIEGIRTRFPDHDVHAEEGTGGRRTSEYCWIIDPLDGTTNYAHRFPFFGVSIGLIKGGELIAGTIYYPVRDELFTAERGAGAQLNGTPLRVSEIARLEDGLLATGFAYVHREEARVENVDHFESFLRRGIPVRRPGAAAIDLAYVACGRLDGFWELKLKPWDMAAGVLMIQEAGGRVSSLQGGAFDLYGSEIVASNGVIHEQMLEVLNEHE